MSQCDNVEIHASMPHCKCALLVFLAIVFFVVCSGIHRLQNVRNIFLVVLTPLTSSSLPDTNIDPKSY